MRDSNTLKISLNPEESRHGLVKMTYSGDNCWCPWGAHKQTKNINDLLRILGINGYFSIENIKYKNPFDNLLGPCFFRDDHILGCLFWSSAKIWQYLSDPFIGHTILWPLLCLEVLPYAMAQMRGTWKWFQAPWGCKIGKARKECSFSGPCCWGEWRILSPRPGRRKLQRWSGQCRVQCSGSLRATRPMSHHSPKPE